MNAIDRYQAYADAFEETYADDNWDRLIEYFSDDAVYAPGDGTETSGRDAVIALLQNAVDGLDRQFDSRELTSSAPTLAGNTVSISWRLTLRKAGLPDLVATGVENAIMEDGCISHMEDVFDAGVGEAVATWMAEHGASLST